MPEFPKDTEVTPEQLDRILKIAKEQRDQDEKPNVFNDPKWLAWIKRHYPNARIPISLKKPD